MDGAKLGTETPALEDSG